MGNRSVLTYFIYILGASLLFFCVATAGSAAADTFVFGKRFGDHTYAGPFNLSKQTDQEAEVKLRSELLGMQDKLQADLVYQDTTFQMPTELVEYNPAATVEQAQSESENSLVATVSEDGLRTLLSQELPMLTISDSEIASIAAGISKKLETGIMPQSVTLTDYLESSQPTTEIATSSVAVNGFTRPMLDVLEELDGFQMKPKTPFSLLTFIDEVQPGLLEEDEQTILASALYSAALQTNFWVEDRTVRRALTEAVQPGFEAAINPNLGLDYVMTNPNDTSYTVHANWKDGSLNVSIEGLPLRYEYEPYVAETNKFKPKTVVQYSEDLLTGQVVVAEPGKDGFEIIVQRRIYEDGALLSTEPVSEDFYPPVSRVEQLPLIAPESSSNNDGQPSDSSGNSGPNDSNNSSGSGSSPIADGTNSNDDNSSSDNNSPDGTNSNGNDSSNNNSQNGSGGTNNSNSNGTNGSNTNKPSQNGGNSNGDSTANPDKKEPVYDKGGQLVE
ncbi:G5 domain-containing protein [Sporosarcina aquimarina]|uniref:G5 domain-containing protein n=1 Tax=Sporosarcina aquimarina TaxID=114975 RepID=A0ABU4FY48_9BACL|nr:G5 domain-containing protein [Sporosarcina aquimarina]MDW0109648.1 G5 domain-containing protein [Sporosarcina aquimarina]